MVGIRCGNMFLTREHTFRLKGMEFKSILFAKQYLARHREEIFQKNPQLDEEDIELCELSSTGRDSN